MYYVVVNEGGGWVVRFQDCVGSAAFIVLENWVNAGIRCYLEFRKLNVRQLSYEKNGALAGWSAPAASPLLVPVYQKCSKD